MENDPTIQHVSDTAIWVAQYRAVESDRPDALFHDPLAKKLVGTRGRAIADHMASNSRMTEYQVVIRTYVIDQFIKEQVAAGIDTVINLGAGLDTRPYRLELNPKLHWIEIDYPALIETKTNLLKDEIPNVKLTRIALDLANREARQSLFKKLSTESKRVLILTEGVLPYLTETQVGDLADDLHATEHFEYWLTEYFSAEVYRYLKGRKRVKEMKNAPMQFFPKDWLAFFRTHGWVPKERRYVAKTGIDAGRMPPFPWFAYILIWFTSRKKREELKQQNGYFLYSKI